MKRLTTTQKLWGTLGIIWIAMLLLVGWLAWENRQTLENERRASIEHIVKSVHGQLEALQKRAELGAVQNRFQSTIRNQSNIAENLSAARSRIQDTDFATETANLTKMQILQQASSSILSQANQRPQVALSLLG